MSEPMENLRLAILRQAVKDYKKALRDGNEKKAREVERFFKSDWGELLSGNHGDYIISECRRRLRRREPRRYATIK